MKNVIVITLKNDIKYHIGIEKEVDDILKEIENANFFYKPHVNCAIKKDEIISVESYEMEVNEDGKN